MKPPKFRIAIVRQTYMSHGGAERFVQNMLDALQKHTETEITLITRKWSQQHLEQIRILQCNPFYIGRLWRDWSFARQACKIIKQHKNEFDLIQSHERILCTDIYRAGEGVHREWLNQRQRVRPWWNQVWDTVSPYHRYILRQEKRVFENSCLQAVITNSQITKSEIERHFPNRKAPITVIPNAVNQENFHPSLREEHRAKALFALNIPENSHVSIFIGSGYERKGVSELLKVFKSLDHAYHVIIIGKDKNQGAFEKKAKRMGLATRVHFLGPKKDVRPYLGAADLFVFPSLYDPLPNSALEAAASGLPVISSKTTGAADITKTWGIDAPDPLDTNAWIKAIKLASQCKMPRADLTKNTEQAMSGKLWTLYKKVVENKSEAL